jgi:hypothetical protein
MAMTENEKRIAKIARNAEKRQRIERELADVRSQGDELIVIAHQAGVPKLTLSRTARLTRATIYNILLRAEAAR